MKILTLIWSIGIGGTERAAVNYAIGYKVMGQASKVLVLGGGHERYNELMEWKVDTTLVVESDKPISSILSELKIWEPDIIHIHNYSEGILKYINALKGIHTKVVETNVFSRPNYSSGYQVVDLSMQLSAWGYWKYARWMKNASYSPQSAIVPYIVGTSKFKVPARELIQSFLRSNNIPPNAYVIGRLGQAHPSKWDKRLLEVIKQTIHEENNIFYLLVGVPDNLLDLFKEQNDFFNSRVIKINKIEGDINLAVYYYSLNCFAHISKIGESFGYVLAEALVCKVPVITMLTPLNDNAQFEVVGHEYGGLCVTNVKDFIFAIHKLNVDEKLRSEFIANLDTWIDSRFSYEKIIPKQLELYKKLLNGIKLPLENVSSTINANISLYKSKKWLTFFVAKNVNNPVVYNLLAKLKGLKKKFF